VSCVTATEPAWDRGIGSLGPRIHDLKKSRRIGSMRTSIGKIRVAAILVLGLVLASAVRAGKEGEGTA
jgi:hypothetical protein